MDGVGSGMHIDDEPDEIFPLPVHRMVKTHCNDVPGAVDFLTRYGTFWSGSNLLVRDAKKALRRDREIEPQLHQGVPARFDRRQSHQRHGLSRSELTPSPLRRRQTTAVSGTIQPVVGQSRHGVLERVRQGGRKTRGRLEQTRPPHRGRNVHALHNALARRPEQARQAVSSQADVAFRVHTGHVSHSPRRAKVFIAGSGTKRASIQASRKCTRSELGVRDCSDSVVREPAVLAAKVWRLGPISGILLRRLTIELHTNPRLGRHG